LKGGAGLYALISLMVLGWSGNYIAGKTALADLPPVLLFGLRISLAGVLMLPVYWWDRRRAKKTWTMADLPTLVVLGLLGVALNQFLFILGLSRTSVAHAAIFANMTPILVVLLARIRGLEKITALKVTGVVVALAGVVLLRTLDARPHGAAASFSGDLFTFCGSLAFAMFTVLGKPATRQHGTIAVNTVAYIGGAVVMAPVTLWQSARFSFAAVSAAAWVSLGYMAVLPSVICYLIYYHALAHMEASRLAAFSYLLPPLATVMGIFLLNEHVTVALVVSALVIFTGVYLVERGQ